MEKDAKMNNQQRIDPFLDTLWSERGLSHHTLAAYRHDLTRLVNWLTATRLSDLAQSKR